MPQRESDANDPHAAKGSVKGTCEGTGEQLMDDGRKMPEKPKKPKKEN